MGGRLVLLLVRGSCRWTCHGRLLNLGASSVLRQNCLARIGVGLLGAGAFSLDAQWLIFEIFRRLLAFFKLFAGLRGLAIASNLA